ncbi:MAG: T9SS type A sorting domain-containing protein [Bacteroidia bacterium]|nr:T9SS type A sorting domain-containing protein [Bacteroidia bacterium]
MKKIFYFLFLTMILNIPILLMGQERLKKVCGTMEYNQRLMNENPSFRAHTEAFEKKMKDISSRPMRTTSQVIIIPVVVHNVYKDATDSITMTDVLSQIDSMNKDFRLLNADKTLIPAAWTNIASDFEIEFCLAARDPQGNPTTGLVHTKTTVPSFSTNDDIKSTAAGGVDAWPTGDYLNIWVGDLGGGLLGYAQFPGGPAATDGVVIGYNCFGSQNPGLIPQYALGRTAPHEIGHWLGLRHIWGDAPGCTPDDGIADTPAQENQNFGCPTFPLLDACQTSAPGVMFYNYMDYCDDPCLVMFTNGQKSVARALFDPGGDRESLLNSAATNCTLPPPPIFVDAGIQSITSPVDTACSSKVTPVFTLTNVGNVTLTTAVIEYSIDGGTPVTYSWSGSLDSLETDIITLPFLTTTPGSHTITFTVVSSNGSPDAVTGNNSLSQTFFVLTLGGTPLPYFVDFESAVFPPNNIVISNPDNGITWELATNAAALGSQSTKIRNINNNSAGAQDELQLPDFDFSNYQTPQLQFDWAYAPYTLGASDTLEVLISTDCGFTYDKIVDMAGSALQTGNAITSPFVPTLHNWKHKIVNLSAYGNAPSAKIRFRNISGYENNLYLDNINVTAIPTTVSLTPSFNLNQSVSIYPNPANGTLNIQLFANENGKLTMDMTDVTGKAVQTVSWIYQEGQNDWKVDLTMLASGMYFIHLNNEKESMVQSLIVR